jgi:hypothetical protein
MGGDAFDEPMAEKTMCDVLGIASEPSDDDVEEENGGPPVSDIEEDEDSEIAVGILSVACLAVGMVGMRRTIRGTLNLPLHAPGLLHSDEFWWPHDRDAQVRVTRFGIPVIYIYIYIYIYIETLLDTLGAE